MNRTPFATLAAALLAATAFAAQGQTENEVVQIAAGSDHTCALTTSGRVWCWGFNYFGQLGTGDPAPSELDAPREVAGLGPGIKAIGVGASYSCAVTEAGEVRCWGENGNGQLGNGSMQDSSSPVTVSGLDEKVVAVVGGYNKTCALTETGRVLCWGLLRYDLTCTNGSGAPVCTQAPVIHGPIENPGAGALSVLKNCVMISPRRLACWAGTALASFDLDASAVAASAGFCALRSSGELTCEGSNNYGQLGIGTTTSVAGPQVPRLPGVAAALAAGHQHICALQTDGHVYCWGINQWGQTGQPGVFESLLPARVEIEGAVMAISAGDDHTCAITARRGVKCWGASRLLGDGGTAQKFGPVDVAGLRGKAVNHQGLWWNAPSGSQPGWGLQIDQQGGVLFAVWYTYGSDGEGIWLAMPSARRNVDGSYWGALYRTTAPGNGAGVTTAQAGSAALEFTDASNGVLHYRMGEHADSRMITRQQFGAAMPSCTESVEAGTPNYQGMWWRSPAGSEPGWGLSIAHQGETLFATWFTYGSDGKGRWLVASRAERTAPGQYSGTLYETRGPAYDAEPWNPQAVAISAVGTATFAFSDADNGVFTSTLGGVAQSRPVTRQLFGWPRTVCR